MATITWGAFNTADAITGWNTSLASLGGTSPPYYNLSTTVVDNTSGLYQNAVIELVLPSAVTCGAGAPFVGFTLVYALDGTNYPSPPTGTNATGLQQTCSVAAVASASFTRGHSLPFLIMPGKFKLLMNQSLVVAFPASGSFAVNVYRFAETVA